MLKIHPRIATERLLLRPYVADDAAALARHGGDAAIAETMLDWPHPFSAANARSTIAAQAASYQAGRAVHFAIQRRQEPGLIGGIELGDLDDRHRRGALRFWIAQPEWGQGYAREAASAVLRFAFGELRLHRVDAMRLVRCPRGAAVLEAIGMREEGILRERVRKGAGWEDVALAAALSSDAAAARRAPAVASASPSV